MRVLITGANGFVATHLIHALSSDKTHQLYGLVCSVEGNNPEVTYCKADINELFSVERCLQLAQPDAIFHLAAQSNVPDSYSKPYYTFQTNIGGTLNLLEATRKYCPEARFIYISSADVYGASFEDGLLVNEETVLRPLNPYASSKVAAEILVREYHKSFGLKTIICRSFNHIGAGQSDKFVIPHFAKQLVEIEAQHSPPILKTGLLSAERDFLTIDRVIQAYLCVLLGDIDGLNGEVFNICSGISRSIQSILDILLKWANCSVLVEQIPALGRPNDIKRVNASNHKFRQYFPQWSGECDLNHGLLEILNYYRSLKVK